MLKKIKDALKYDPDTGKFFWIVNNNRGRKGAEAGCLYSSGYIYICVFKKMYRAHRLAWMFVYGETPAGQLDHINGCRRDNRIKNLRLASNTENQRNSKIRCTNTSGYKGVSFDKPTMKWRARCEINGKSYDLGYFKTIKAASSSYESFTKSKFGNFYRPLTKVQK